MYSWLVMIAIWYEGKSSRSLLLRPQVAYQPPAPPPPTPPPTEPPPAEADEPGGVLPALTASPKLVPKRAALKVYPPASQTGC